jgi:hypothetical protein
VRRGRDKIGINEEKNNWKRGEKTWEREKRWEVKNKWIINWNK